MDIDGMHEECGVAGVFDSPNSAKLVREMLESIQHRGQESAGIAVANGGEILLHKAMGLVTEALTDDAIRPLTGNKGIGHNRYSLTGASDLAHAQPLTADTRFGWIAIAHNGNLTNASELRALLLDQNVSFQTESDTEVILGLIVKSVADNLEDAIVEAIKQLKGSFCLLILAANQLFAIRDPYGVRPLVIGDFPPDIEGATTVVASEACALADIGARYIRNINPGEMVTCGPARITSHYPWANKVAEAACIFEFVYFARPDTEDLFKTGQSVAGFRVRSGQILAEESPANADIVVAIPDSGIQPANGYAVQSGLTRQQGLMKNRYSGERAFIKPKQEDRADYVKKKFIPIGYVLRGQRVVLVDDSIVRATTIKYLIIMLRDRGATEVHVRIASPPVRWPCFFGIDTEKRQSLIAAQKDVEQIRVSIGADSLAYLSMEGLLKAAGQETDQPGRFCDACFTGKYVLVPPESRIKVLKSLKEADGRKAK